MANLDQLMAEVDRHEDEIVSLLADLVRFPTVNTGVMPTGNELVVCEYIQNRLRREGIDSQILQSAEQRGNLVATLPGRRNGGPRLLFMGHTDVVPVDDESQWRFPPFSATVAEGRLWGRGAADMKDLVAAELMAAIILKRSGVRLDGDLVVAAAADEETGGKYGFGWLAEHVPAAIKADFALNEAGGGPIRTDRGLLYTIQVGEKGRLEAHITLRGLAAHAATPWAGDNASFKLAEVLRRLAAYEPERNVSQPFFDQLGALIGREAPISAENVDELAGDMIRTNRPLGLSLLSLSRMTIVPTVLSGGVKSNSVPAGCTLVCDVRTLPHQDEAYVRRQIEGILEGIDGASYELVYTAVPSASPYDTEFAAAVRRATEVALGRNDLQWLPSLVAGFTDSRLVRPLGTVVYGFNPDHPDVDPSIPSGAHGANESTDIRSLVLNTKMLVALAFQVLGGGAE